MNKYHKVPKFWDAIKFCCYLPKIQTKRLNLSVFRHKDANGKANSEDPDQTAPRSSLIWVCTVCQDQSVRKLRIIRVRCRQSMHLDSQISALLFAGLKV